MVKITKRIFFFSLIAILSSIPAKVSLAATAAVPTVGLAATSIVVGGAAVLGGGWKTRLGGFLVGVVDPDPAAFYQGKIVLTYPEDILAVTGVGWFGNFSATPSLPVPPVISSPFFEYDHENPSYDFMQLPNPIINALVNDTGGQIIVEFDASSNGGVTIDSDTHFNMLAITFQNISNGELILEQVGGGVPITTGEISISESANFFSNTNQQILTCIPDPSIPNSVPVTCGNDIEPYTYQISIASTPEPNSLFGVLTLGTISVVSIIKGKKKNGSTELV